MDKETKQFLTENFIPPHVQCLLELVGVNFLVDVVEVNEPFINNVEKQIKDGKLQNLVDFSSKANRMKYFGLDVPDVKSFEIRMLDRMKLLKISEAAKEKL